MFVYKYEGPCKSCGIKILVVSVDPEDHCDRCYSNAKRAKLPYEATCTWTKEDTVKEEVRKTFRIIGVDIDKLRARWVVYV